MWKQEKSTYLCETSYKLTAKQPWHQNQVYIVPVHLYSTGLIPKNFLNSIKYLDLPKNTDIQLNKSL
jgi:hypothetical protein